MHFVCLFSTVVCTHKVISDLLSPGLQNYKFHAKGAKMAFFFFPALLTRLQRFVSSTVNMDVLLSHLKHCTCFVNENMKKNLSKVGYFRKIAKIFHTAKIDWWKLAYSFFHVFTTCYKPLVGVCFPRIFCSVYHVRSGKMIKTTMTNNNWHALCKLN